MTAIEGGYFWKIVVLLGAGTFLIRSLIIFFSSKINFSDRVKEIFSFIPAAILPALVTPLVFFHEGGVSFIFGKERLLLLLLSCFVCYKSKSIMFTILFGLAALYFSRFLAF